jgi:hypothetical protein
LGWLLSRISGFAWYSPEPVPALIPQTRCSTHGQRNQANGTIVTFEIKGRKESGFWYSTEAVGRKIVKVRIWKILTRAEVEVVRGIYREKGAIRTTCYAVANLKRIIFTPNWPGVPRLPPGHILLQGLSLLPQPLGRWS